MSRLADVQMMKTLVDIKYRQEQESFERLKAEEDRLRAGLRKLDVQMLESRSSGDAQQRAIGADVQWQAWIGRKKRELNMRLAQVLAIKERHIAQVRKAYGKVLVSTELLDQLQADTRKQKAQSDLDRASDAFVAGRHQ